jgi:hypothetical protein
MATVESYDTAKGPRYRVRYRTPDRRPTQKRGFKSKRAANEFADTIEVDMRRGEYVAPSAGRVTVGELGTAWLDRQAHLKPATRQNNANCSPARATSMKSSTPVPLTTAPTQSMNFASETTGTPSSRAR